MDEIGVFTLQMSNAQDDSPSTKWERRRAVGRFIMFTWLSVFYGVYNHNIYLCFNCKCWFYVREQMVQMAFLHGELDIVF
jgi:hypothetical protein